MGEDWDNLDWRDMERISDFETLHAQQAWHLEWVKEAFRVIRSGGVIKAFGGTRTFHRLAAAMTSAGFADVRLEAWTYGSGFPKSLDISKSLDKKREEDIEPLRRVCRFLRAAMEARGLKEADLTGPFNCTPSMIGHWAARDTNSQPSLPQWEQWLELKKMVGFGDEMDAEVWRLNGRKGQPSDKWQTAEVIGHYEKAPAGGFLCDRFYARDNLIRAPSSEGAKKFFGYGTTLKPAWEPFLVGRRP